MGEINCSSGQGRGYPIVNVKIEERIIDTCNLSGFFFSKC